MRHCTGRPPRPIFEHVRLCWRWGIFGCHKLDVCKKLSVPIVVIIPRSTYMQRLNWIWGRVLHGVGADKRYGEHRETAWCEHAADLCECCSIVIDEPQHV